MKKLSLLFLVLLAFGTFFQACDNTKTYAERLADERRAIRKFVEKHNIKTISQSEFEKDTITDVSKNEYVLLDGDVYLQIVDRGSGDSIKSRNLVILRMVEYNIMSEIDNKVSGDSLSNIEWYGVDPDAFYYDPNLSVCYYKEGYIAGLYYQAYSQNLEVPRGIIDIIPYIRDKAHVRIIVPSKKGHSIANNFTNVHPYYYDIHQIIKAKSQ